MRELSLSSIQISDAATGDIWELYFDGVEEGETEYDLNITTRARLLHDGSTGAPVNQFAPGTEPDTSAAAGVERVALPRERRALRSNSQLPSRR